VRARIITFAALALAIVILSVGGWAAASVLPGGGVLIAYGSALIVVLATALVLWRGTARLTEGLRALAAANPEGVAFLARRLPPAVSDLPAFMRAKGFAEEIGDGWYIGLADYRGLTAWSPERRPRELLLMDWLEVGDVLAVHASTVDDDSPGRVTVDVRPYVVPLTVEVGYAWGLVTMKLDGVDTADLVSAVTAHRP
jgi:hypothetical protein